MTHLSIDPNSHQLVGAEDAPYNADTIRRIEPPVCPVCAATVEIDWIDVTLNEEQERQYGRQYMSGMWHCPHDCNPETGKRFHRDQTIWDSLDGIRFECSCGADNDELAALQERHPLGEER